MTSPKLFNLMKRNASPIQQPKHKLNLNLTSFTGKTSSRTRPASSSRPSSCEFIDRPLSQCCISSVKWAILSLFLLSSYLTIGLEVFVGAFFSECKKTVYRVAWGIQPTTIFY